MSAAASQTRQQDRGDRTDNRSLPNKVNERPADRAGDDVVEHHVSHGLSPFVDALRASVGFRAVLLLTRVWWPAPASGVSRPSRETLAPVDLPRGAVVFLPRRSWPDTDECGSVPRAS